MQYFEIPLTPAPQRFTAPLAGVTYSFNLYWNIPTQTWCLDILTEQQVPLVTALPLVTGVDLLGQFRHLGIGGSLLVQVDGDSYGLPTYDNLGTESHLLFGVE